MFCEKNAIFSLVLDGYILGGGHKKSHQLSFLCLYDVQQELQPLWAFFKHKTTISSIFPASAFTADSASAQVLADLSKKV